MSKIKELENAVTLLERALDDARDTLQKAYEEKCGLKQGVVVIDKRGEYFVEGVDFEMGYEAVPWLKVRKKKIDGTWEDRTRTLFDGYKIKKAKP